MHPKNKRKEKIDMKNEHLSKYIVERVAGIFWLYVELELFFFLPVSRKYEDRRKSWNDKTKKKTKR